MPNKDVVIPIVFPDYRITVATPAVKVNVPLLPGITIPATKQKVPFLGHAGVLFIDGKTGLTKYFEYGRYDPAAKGLVRNVPVPDVKMGDNGRPTRQTLAGALAAVSRKSGQGGRLKGAYIELDPGAFHRMLSYATNRLKANADPQRAPYELLSNSCLHFMKQVAEAGGARMPTVIAPQPAGYIIQVRLMQKDLDFGLPGKLTVEDISLD